MKMAHCGDQKWPRSPYRTAKSIDPDFATDYYPGAHSFPSGTPSPARSSTTKRTGTRAEPGARLVVAPRKTRRYDPQMGASRSFILQAARLAASLAMAASAAAAMAGLPAGRSEE